jgi:replication factor C small subunit
VERYRPKKVEECILPEELKSPFAEYVKKGEIPNLLLSGRAGVGKTTIARALCEEVGAEYILINGSLERGLDTVRVTMDSFAGSVSLMGGRKVIIVDEADNLTPDAQKSLRGVIEKFAVNCSFIFTCNYPERLLPELISRFPHIVFTLKEKDKVTIMGAFFTRLKEILKKEEIQFDPKILSEVVKRFFPDFRKTLNELQLYCASGTLNTTILSKLSDAQFNEIFGLIKKKDYIGLRRWVGTNASNDTGAIMRGIYDRMETHLDPQSLPFAIILLGKYQYYASQVQDREVNLMAFLTEIIIECQITS